MYLTKFSFNNKNYTEDKTLPRIIISEEDMQCVYKYESNKKILL